MSKQLEIKTKKFKVWIRDTKRFLDATVTPYNWLCNSYREDNLIFLLYSGFTDIKEREICEGDFIQLIFSPDERGDVYLVKFEKGLFQILDDIHMGLYLDYEIVGNVFEDPEINYKGKNAA